MFIFKFKNYPFPPSINDYLKHGKNHNGFFLSQSHKRYKEQVKSWYKRNFRSINEFKDFLKSYSYDKNLSCLRMDMTFVLLKSRFITKENRVKKQKNDTDNFIKPVKDTFSKLIQIDDSIFNAHNIERVYCKKETEQQVIITIIPDSIKEFRIE